MASAMNVGVSICLIVDIYRIRKGSERRFATPSCQRLNIISGHVTVIQPYIHTVVGDASVEFLKNSRLGELNRKGGVGEWAFRLMLRSSSKWVI